jgi:putative membrane protein
MFSGGIFSLGMMGMGFFWLVVILLALQWFGNQNYKETHLESLKKRLSRGEITVEEYEKIKEKMKE